MGPERKQVPIKARITAIATLGTAAFLAACRGEEEKPLELTPITPTEIPSPTVTLESDASPTVEVETSEKGVIDLGDWRLAIKIWEEKPESAGFKTVEVQAIMKNVSDEMLSNGLFDYCCGNFDLEISAKVNDKEFSFAAGPSFPLLEEYGVGGGYIPIPPGFGIPVRITASVPEIHQNYSLRVDGGQSVTKEVRRGEVASDLSQISPEVEIKNPGEPSEIPEFASFVFNRWYKVTNDNPSESDDWLEQQYVSFDIQNNYGEGISIIPRADDFEAMVFLKDGRVIYSSRVVSEDYEIIIAPGFKKTIDIRLGAIYAESFDSIGLVSTVSGETYPLEGSVVVAIFSGDPLEAQFVGAWRVP